MSDYWQHWGVVRDGRGNSLNGMSILVSLTGTTTAATIYDEDYDAIASSTVTSDSKGYFEFWVSDGDYARENLFRLTISGDGFETSTFDAVKIFGVSPAINPALYGDHTANGTIFAKTQAGIVWGNIVYPGASGFALAKADSAATMPCVAFCVVDGVTFMSSGFIRDDSWSWTAGDLLYVSKDTAGAITATAPSTSTNQVQCIGYALSATIIYFNPPMTFIEVP